MNTFLEILIYIIDTLGGLFLLIVLLRLMLQLVRADFYNPISQGIATATNPLILPLRKIIPGVFGIDVATILLSLVIQVAIGELIFFIAFQSFYNPANLVLWAVLGNMMVISWIILISLLVVVVSSWIAPYSSHPIIILTQQIITPIVNPLRNIIPPIGGFDLSVFFAGMGIVIAQKILTGVAAGIGVQPLLVIGF